jgi:hypothetical protein
MVVLMISTLTSETLATTPDDGGLPFWRQVKDGKLPSFSLTAYSYLPGPSVLRLNNDSSYGGHCGKPNNKKESHPMTLKERYHRPPWLSSIFPNFVSAIAYRGSASPLLQQLYLSHTMQAASGSFSPSLNFSPLLTIFRHQQLPHFENKAIYFRSTCR